MLEAALISEFYKRPGCGNQANNGAEGGLNRKDHAGPPYYVYIVGARADQMRWIGECAVCRQKRM